MSTVSDNLLFQSDTTKKYDIPLTHLDYPYIEKCKDVKELERILRVLRSGDEGFYPDLEKFCEQKIEKLNPSSRVLRKEVPLGRPGDLARDEWQQIDSDLKNWELEMKTVESNKKKILDEFDDPELPPIRSGVINGHTCQENQANEASKKNKRVTPRNYKEWDKFDIDKELDEVDKQEEKKAVTKKSKPPKIDTNINTTGMTDEEKIMKAGKEKDKGNEAFRAGDYEEAIAYYTRSIKLHSTAASYNNRAIAYIKTSQWVNAADDCNRVLNIEPDNIKALLRRGTAYKGMKEFAQALADYNKVLELEPENKRAQDLIAELETEEKKFEEEKRKRKEKGRRMVIEEVDEESEDEIVVDKKPNEGKTNEKLVNGHSDEKNEEKLAEIKPGSEIKTGENSTKESADSKIQKENDRNNALQSESKKSASLTDHTSKSESRKNENKVENQNKDIWNKDDIKTPQESFNIDSSKIDSKNNEKGSKLHPQNETENRLGFSQSHKQSADSSSEGCDKPSEMGRTKEKDIEDKGNEKKGTLENEKLTTNSSISDRPVYVQRPLSKGVAELRESGNTLFRAGQYGDAIHKYSMAIEKIQKEKTDQRVNLSFLHSNRAACYLKTGDTRHTIQDCTTALDLVPHSIKPLLRRANAYEVLERYREAYADYKHVLSIDLSVDMALQGSNRCQKHLIDTDGLKWREKLPRVPSVQSWEIPEVVDSTGNPTTAQPINSSVTKASSSQPINNDIPSTRKEQSKLKEKSPEERFDELKSEGNSFVQKGEYQKAVPCYTQCIEILPDKAASYTNRSLCYLKLNKPEDSETDCTKALSLEKDNVKALFRRAQSRKMLKRHKESLEDLNQLLKVDPKNTAAKKEMDIVKGLWREELNNMKKKMEKPVDNKPRKRVVIEETDSEDEDGPTTGSKDNAKSTVPSNSSTSTETKPPTKQSETKTESKQSYSEEKKSQPKTDKSTDKKSNQSVKKESEGSQNSKQPSKSPSSSIKQTSFGLPQTVPKLEKATPYEFITAWNSLKQSTDLQPYADLLRQISPADLPKVISNKLDGGMLSKISKCVAEKFTGKGDLKTSYEILSNVSKVPRFDTIAMFMSKTEKKDIETVLDKVLATDLASKEEIGQLKKKYSL